MVEDDADAARCPLCGEPSLCAMAAGEFDEPCWCAQIEISSRAIAKLPAHEQRTRCLCPRCAVG